MAFTAGRGVDETFGFAERNQAMAATANTAAMPMKSGFPDWPGFAACGMGIEWGRLGAPAATTSVFIAWVV